MTLVPSLKHTESRPQGAFGKPLRLALKSRGTLIDFTDLTTPAIKFRLRTQIRADAVTGLGTLQIFVDPSDPAEFNAEYIWNVADIDVPGLYLVEVDATEGGAVTTYPDDGERMYVRIIEDVGA